MSLSIKVRLKRDVRDPQGEAVRQALHALGFDSVKDVRIGKLIEVDVPELDAATGEAMCRKLLANPVLEDFEVEVA